MNKFIGYSLLWCLVILLMFVFLKGFKKDNRYTQNDAFSDFLKIRGYDVTNRTINYPSILDTNKLDRPKHKAPYERDAYIVKFESSLLPQIDSLINFMKNANVPKSQFYYYPFDKTTLYFKHLDQLSNSFGVNNTALINLFATGKYRAYLNHYLILDDITPTSPTGVSTMKRESGGPTSNGGVSSMTRENGMYDYNLYSIDVIDRTEFLIMRDSMKTIDARLNSMRDNDYTNSIGVLDSGFDPTSPYCSIINNKPVVDPASSSFRLVGYNFIDTLAPAIDEIGHGSQIIALMKEKLVNSNYKVFPMKVIDANGVVDKVKLAAAITLATQLKLKALNMSFGGYGYDTLIATLINEYTHPTGISGQTPPPARFVCTSIGNDGLTLPHVENLETIDHFPSCLSLTNPNVIEVSAARAVTNINDLTIYSAYSNRRIRARQDVYLRVLAKALGYNSSDGHASFFQNRTAGTSFAAPRATCYFLINDGIPTGNVDSIYIEN